MTVRTIEEIRAMRSGTNWDHLREQGDYEGPAEFEVDFSKARLVQPDTPPFPRFTTDQLCAAHKVAEPWRGTQTLFWEMAVTALLDRPATDDDVERFRPLIRQAVEEGR